MSLFIHSVEVNGSKALNKCARVDAEGRFVRSDASDASDNWKIGLWFSAQKQNLKNPSKKEAVYAMLTQDGTNEIVKAQLDKFLEEHSRRAEAEAKERARREAIAVATFEARKAPTF